MIYTDFLTGEKWKFGKEKLHSTRKNPVENFLTKKDFSTGFSTFKQTFPQPLWKLLEVFHRIVVEKVVFNQCIKNFILI